MKANIFILCKTNFKLLLFVSVEFHHCPRFAFSIQCRVHGPTEMYTNNNTYLIK